VGQTKDAQAGRADDANALRIYHGNFDTALHDPERAPLGATTEAVAWLPMLVLAGADDGCIPPALFAAAVSLESTGSGR
jgi:hypothetical protein